MYRTGAHRAAPDPMSAGVPATSPGGQVVVYEVEGGEARVDVRFERETVWLTQRQMAGLFETSTDNISLHLNNIFSTQELGRGSNYRGFLGSSNRGQSSGQTDADSLQPRRHHLRRVPRQFPTRRALSPMGHPHPARPPGPRLHPQPAHHLPGHARVKVRWLHHPSPTTPPDHAKIHHGQPRIPLSSRPTDYLRPLGARRKTWPRGWR